MFQGKITGGIHHTLQSAVNEKVKKTGCDREDGTRVTPIRIYWRAALKKLTSLHLP
jgi:hypothetical protein